MYLKLSSEITPQEIQDKVINLSSFYKTKGNKHWLSVQPLSLFMVIQMTSPMSPFLSSYSSDLK